MPITWRKAVVEDIGPCLTLQPTNRGDAFRDVTSAIEQWKMLFADPFFLSVVIEATSPIQGNRLIGFGAGVFVCRNFADAEVAIPRAYIASRVLASQAEGRSVLASRESIARNNALEGTDIIILFNAYRANILDAETRHAVRMVFVNSLMQALSGFRISRILAETTNKPMEALHRESPEYQIIAEFPTIGHVIHLMTRQSATSLPGSVANPLFNSARPVLRLRESDQELLLAALENATDDELACHLGVTLSAVKARWRSTFAKIAEQMPVLVDEEFRQGSRGNQKRHHVLAYMRHHMEELRPYDWTVRAEKAATR